MIYFDNAATSYPKPVSVLKSAATALRRFSFNSGRGGYRASVKAAERIYEVREQIGAMFGFLPQNVVFTKNCTEALNIAIKGSVKKGEHLIISSLEHNSVSRVAQALSDSGFADYDIAKYDPDVDVCVKHFKEKIKDNTTAIVCMHSSNVFGVKLPLREIGRLCRERGIRFIVDAAQGAGADDIHTDDIPMDILCAPGHKGLFGPMGTGFLAVKEGVSLIPLMQGGTGSRSLMLQQPSNLPDMLESGTLNNGGILALGEGLRFIHTIGTRHILVHELSLCRYLYEAMAEMPGIILYTPVPDGIGSMPLISFNYKAYSSEAVAARLADYEICVRAGYHCAPLAHRHFHTLDSGTVRLSPGYFNSLQDCDEFLNVLKKF